MYLNQLFPKESYGTGGGEEAVYIFLVLQLKKNVPLHFKEKVAPPKYTYIIQQTQKCNLPITIEMSQAYDI